MKVITTKLPDDMHTKLRIHVLTHGTTVSDFVRDLIEEKLKKEEQDAEQG